MNVRSEAAAAARRVAAARQELDDPPPLDAAAWLELLDRIDRLTGTADHAQALAAIHTWEVEALNFHHMTSPRASTPPPGRPVTDRRAGPSPPPTGAIRQPGGGQPSETRTHPRKDTR